MPAPNAQVKEKNECRIYRQTPLELLSDFIHIFTYYMPNIPLVTMNSFTSYDSEISQENPTFLDSCRSL